MPPRFAPDFCDKFDRLTERLFATPLDNPREAELLCGHINSLRTEIQFACKVGSITAAEVRWSLRATHNVHMMASYLVSSQEAVDKLCADFASQIRFSSLPSAFNTQSVDIESRCTLRATALLKEWCRRHMSYLYPAKSELAELSVQTGMSSSQVTLWFRNARTRSGWSKLYGHEIYVGKDRLRLARLLQSYQSVDHLHTSEKVQGIISAEESYQMVEKVSRWFQTKKISAPSKMPVKPWIKSVLSSEMKATRQDAQERTISPRQVLLESSSESLRQALSTTEVYSSSSSSDSSCSSGSPCSVSGSSPSSTRSSSPASTCTSAPLRVSSYSTCIPPSPGIFGSLGEFSSLLIKPSGFSSLVSTSSPLSATTLNQICSHVSNAISGAIPACSSSPDLPFLSNSFSFENLINPSLNTVPAIETGQFDDAIEE